MIYTNTSIPKLGKLVVSPLKATGIQEASFPVTMSSVQVEFIAR